MAACLNKLSIICIYTVNCYTFVNCYTYVFIQLTVIQLYNQLFVFIQLDIYCDKQHLFWFQVCTKLNSWKLDFPTNFQNFLVKGSYPYYYYSLNIC